MNDHSSREVKTGCGWKGGPYGGREAPFWAHFPVLVHGDHIKDRASTEMISRSMQELSRKGQSSRGGLRWPKDPQSPLTHYQIGPGKLWPRASMNPECSQECTKIYAQKHTKSKICPVHSPVPKRISNRCLEKTKKLNILLPWIILTCMLTCSNDLDLMDLLNQNPYAHHWF